MAGIRKVWVAGIVLLAMTGGVHADATRLIFKGSDTHFSTDSAFDNGQVEIPDLGRLVRIRFSYALEFWSLFGEPVFLCHAKWQPSAQSGVVVSYSVKGTTDRGGLTVASNQHAARLVRPYALKIAIPVLKGYPSVYAICDPGVLSGAPGKPSFDVPGSPAWDETFFVPVKTVYGKVPKTIEAYKNTRPDKIGNTPIHWLSKDDAIAIAKKLRAQAPAQAGDVYTVQVGGDQFSSFELGGPDAVVVLDVKHDLSGTVRAIAAQTRPKDPQASGPRPASAAESSPQDDSLDDIFADAVEAESDYLSGDEVGEIFTADRDRIAYEKELKANDRLAATATAAQARYEQWQRDKREQVKGRTLPELCTEAEARQSASLCLLEKCGYEPSDPGCVAPCKSNCSGGRHLSLGTTWYCGSQRYARLLDTIRRDKPVYEACVAQNEASCNKKCVVR